MTRLFLGACVLTFGLAFGLTACDGVGTSPDEISRQDSTDAANDFRPSPKDPSAVPESLKQVEPGDTLTIPIKAVANEPDSTEGSGPLEFDSVSVANTVLPVGDEDVENRGTTLEFAAPDSTGELDIRFLPVYGDFVAERKGTLPVTVQEGNQPPTAADDSDMTKQGDTTRTVVLSNDEDPDGSLNSSTVAVQSAPSDGSATANDDGTITYDPDSGFTGTDTYTYTVEDEDGAVSNAATVTIEVSAKDNAPEFEDTDPFSVSETASSGEEVGDVDATDGDGGNPDEGVTYQITAGNTGDALAINMNSGQLTVADSTAIDYEQVESFTLTVKADDGTNQTEADVTVNVTDKTPTISDQTIGPVSETAGEGTVVDKVTSGGDQTSVEYAITENVDPDSNGTNAFEIEDKTGVVAVADTGDLTAGDTLMVTVQVSDEVNSASAMVTIPVDSAGSSLTSDIYRTGEDSVLGTSTLGVDEGNSGTGGVLGPSAVRVRSGPTSGPVTAKDNGMIAYVPDERLYGTVLHTFVVEDSEGSGTNGTLPTAGVGLPRGR